MALKGNVHLSLLIGQINAEPVPREVIECLDSVSVNEDATGQGGFQLSFRVGKDSLIMNELLPGGYFDAARRTIITVTIKGKTEVIMDGIISRQELSASSTPGETRLSITGLDISEIMNRIDFTGLLKWFVPRSVRVLAMIAKYGMYGIIPKVIPSIFIVQPIPIDRMPSQTGTDLTYIKQLASEVGYIFHVQPGPVPGMSTAYWGPQVKTGEPQPALSVNMDAHTNVESLSLSCEGLGKTLFTFYIREPNSGIPIPIPVPDVGLLNPPLGKKIPPVVTHMGLSKFDPDELDNATAKFNALRAAARGLARAANAADVISGSGSLDVVRYGHILKTGKLVAVRGAGILYDGNYYVKSVSHTLKRGEYKQNFQLSRNAFIPFSSTVDM